jgi:3D (Asp-Asp-Asp) domain-containing protein
MRKNVFAGLFVVIMALSSGIGFCQDGWEPMLVVPYCSCEKCCKNHVGETTYFGEDPSQTEGIASDVKVIPLGTILEIQGIGQRLVDSYGLRTNKEKAEKAGVSKIVYLRFSSHKEATGFGQRIIPVRNAGKIGIARPGEAIAGKTIRVKVTGYCPCRICCGKKACGITSTGKSAYGTTGFAADPNIFPYGTRIEIQGMPMPILEVDDSGSDMVKAAKQQFCWIDLRFNSHQEAKKFGTKILTIRIL